MSRILTILLFGLSFPILSGQIYTTKLQAPDGGTVGVHDVSFGPQGQVNIGYMEYVTINPNIPIIANVPWLARFNKRLNHDTLAQPLDSFPITSHHLTSLQSGDLLLGFSGGGFNGYNWTGYSYAILGSGNLTRPTYYLPIFYGEHNSDTVNGQFMPGCPAGRGNPVWGDKLGPWLEFYPPAKAQTPNPNKGNTFKAVEDTFLDQYD